ncbi:MAG: carboxylesterase family protein [Bacteroidia bacterium]|nr:carboxylesterase family protein [Bacteroidia bacterium]
MPHLRDADVDGVKQQLRQQYGDKTDDYIKAVKAAYPQDTRPTDLIDVDDLFRRSAIATADIKVRDGKAPVYMYLFTWQSPVGDGNYKALHCMEIPFVFNNIARCEEMTGGEPGAYALAELVSRAWVNFARRGDPNHDAIPQWTPYTPDNGATMLIDSAWELQHHHDKEFLAIAGDRFF